MRQQLKVKRMQARLGKQIKDFLEASSSFLPSLDDVDLQPVNDKDELINTPAEEFVEPEDLVEEGEDFNEEDDEGEALSRVSQNQSCFNSLRRWSWKSIDKLWNP